MPRSKEQNNCPLHLSGSADPIPAKINHLWPYAKHFFKGSCSRCGAESCWSHRLRPGEGAYRAVAERASSYGSGWQGCDRL